MIEAEPRFPTTVEEFNKFCQAIAFLASPSAASQRLNESAALLRAQFDAHCREKERNFALREIELERREAAVVAHEKELAATAETLKRRQAALAAAVKEFDSASRPPRASRAR
jgi:hypothetical protein